MVVPAFENRFVRKISRNSIFSIVHSRSRRVLCDAGPKPRRASCPLRRSAFFFRTPLASALNHIRVGYLPVTGHAKFFVAKEYGIFAWEGIDAELIEFINSADGLNVLRAGKLDGAAFGTTAPLVHIARGADLLIPVCE
jgi:ABC-type nitrate/sulfonate/bicarbonate transport system substrate-binding protein